MGRLETLPEVDEESQAVVRVLRDRRKQLKWSQPMLATRLGISVETIRAIEQGEHPNLAFFTGARWAGALGIPLDELEPTPDGLPASDVR